MVAPVTAFIAATCFLLGFAGLIIAVVALVSYAKKREPSLVISAVALIMSAIALLVQGLTLIRHFS